MNRRVLTILTGLVIVTADGGAQVVAPPPDTTAAAVFRRAQRLVNDGQGVEGRALVDSMLNAAEPRSSAEAEALYWRAMLAESWDGAQRDYLRLMLEHERSPRAGDAMLRLAQGEVARGDREAAIRYLERLVREAPESPARAEAGLWHGRLLVEQGDPTRGCTVLREARSHVPSGALELENQFEYVLRACPDLTVTPPEAATALAPVIPPQPPPPPAQTTPPVATPPAVVTPTGPTWSFQVAAMSTLDEANALVARLRARGYEARVDGRTALFRVRVGRYQTRAAAAAAANAFKTKEGGDFLVVEVPPG